MELKYYQIDAFTSKVFGGNYAGVIVLDEPLNAQTMQLIAMENNVSETAFLTRLGIGNYAIRWFSPLQEIDFCGHATLASAFVLFEQNPEKNTLCFQTSTVGDIEVKKLPCGKIEMSFPNRKPWPIKVPEGLVDALACKPELVLQNQQAIICVVDSVETLKSLTPDFNALKAFAPLDVCVTTKGEQYDFESRYFWPANGGEEDPVTGSMHAGLAPFWAEQLNKTALMAYQGGSRGGIIYCSVEDETVFVSGYATKYLEGTLFI